MPKLFSKKQFRQGCVKMGLSKPTKDSLSEDEREANKTRFLEILRTVGSRSGIAKLAQKLENSRFFNIGCHGHHRYQGGLAEHSLEVYDFTLKNCRNTPEESIVIAALLHDLGDIEGGQGHTSVAILGKWGFELTKAEYRAIKYHMWTHSSDEKAEFRLAQTEELWRAVTAGDIFSAGGYKFGSKLFMHLISIGVALKLFQR